MFDYMEMVVEELLVEIRHAPETWNEIEVAVDCLEKGILDLHK